MRSSKKRRIKNKQTNKQTNKQKPFPFLLFQESSSGSGNVQQVMHSRRRVRLSQKRISYRGPSLEIIKSRHRNKPRQMESPILVTGAAGRVGAVGRIVAELLLEKGCPVRAMVYREDERAEQLRRLGAEVVVGDLQSPGDVMRAMKGCRRVYFSLSVVPGYLEATTIVAAVAREVCLHPAFFLSFIKSKQHTPLQTTSGKPGNPGEHVADDGVRDEPA